MVPLLARATRDAGQRLLVVAEDAERLARIDKALWSQLPEEFLAHGRANEPHAQRQPALLSETVEAANGAAFAVLADGRWREEAERFDRVFLLIDEASLPEARTCWKAFGEREGVERHFWKRQDGRWVEGP